MPVFANRESESPADRGPSTYRTDASFARTECVDELPLVRRRRTVDGTRGRSALTPASRRHRQHYQRADDLRRLRTCPAPNPARVRRHNDSWSLSAQVTGREGRRRPSAHGKLFLLATMASRGTRAHVLRWSSTSRQRRDPASLRWFPEADHGEKLRTAVREPWSSRPRHLFDRLKLQPDTRRARSRGLARCDVKGR